MEKERLFTLLEIVLLKSEGVKDTNLLLHLKLNINDILQGKELLKYIEEKYGDTNLITKK